MKKMTALLGLVGLVVLQTGLISADEKKPAKPAAAKDKQPAKPSPKQLEGKLQAVKDAAAKSRLKQIDTDGDGKISDKERQAFAERVAKSRAEFAKRQEAEKLKRFDKDGDGKLSEEEEQAYQKRREEIRKAGEELRKKTLEKYDTNKDGKIDQEERKAWNADIQKRQAEYRAKFEARYLEKFDKNKNGKLDDDERAALRKLQAVQAEETRKRVAEALKKFDANGNGRLDKDEAAKYIEARKLELQKKQAENKKKLANPKSVDKKAVKPAAKGDKGKPAPKTDKSPKSTKPAPKKPAKNVDGKPAPKKPTAKKVEAKPAPKPTAKKVEAKPAPKKGESLKASDKEIDPNSKIKNGLLVLVVTDDGRVTTGELVGQSKTDITVKANDKSVTIKRDTIDAIRAVKKAS